MLEHHDVLAAPSAQVVPFPIETEYPTEVAGVAMPHYLGWMRVCSRITVSAHPVAAVPAGFTPDGLPVGLQLVGRHRGDRRLLDHAAAWEAAGGVARRATRRSTDASARERARRQAADADVRGVERAGRGLRRRAEALARGRDVQAVQTLAAERAGGHAAARGRSTSASSVPVGPYRRTAPPS